MQTIPADILEPYTAVLNKRAVPVSCHADYRKWLRYFLDFQNKYPLPEPKSEQVRLFILKLQEKKQTQAQLNQAAHALSLFFETQLRKKHIPTFQYRATNRRSDGGATAGLPLQESVSTLKIAAPQASSRFFVTSSGRSHFNDWRCLKKSKSPEVVMPVFFSMTSSQRNIPQPARNSSGNGSFPSSR